MVDGRLMANGARMAGLLRISEMGALALHAVGMVAADGGGQVTAAGLAERLLASPHTMRQVLRRLVKAGWLRSGRGPAGGFSLAAAPERLSLWQVLEAVEGGSDRGGCLFARPVCGAGFPCPFAGFTREIDSQARRYFQKTTVADLRDALTRTTSADSLRTVRRPKPKTL